MRTTSLSRLTLITQSACAFVALTAAATPSYALIAAPAPAAATYYFGAPTPSFSLLPPSLPQVSSGGQFTDGTATANLSLQPSPNLTLNLSGVHSTVGAAVFYDYIISGPFDASGTIAGTLIASMSVTGTGNMYGAAAITGTDIALTPNNAVCFSSGSYAPDCAFYGYPNSSLSNQIFNVNFHASGQIELAALARVKSFGSASLMIDPVITLPTGYSLTLSQGAGNAAPVPEPATLLMLAAGLGVVGTRVRRRRS